MGLATGTPNLMQRLSRLLTAAITSGIFEQNDPKRRALVFENNGNYWRTRLKAWRTPRCTAPNGRLGR